VVTSGAMAEESEVKEEGGLVDGERKKDAEGPVMC